MNIEIIKDHTEEIAKKIYEQFELEKDSIKEQLLEEIRGFITPVPKLYEWTRGDCPYDDSGEIYVDGLVSLDQTIAEFLENEYTGQTRATFISHQGLDYITYGEWMSDLLAEIKENIVEKTVKKCMEELFGEEFSEDDLVGILEEYYSEIYDEDGNLQRITIIPTNSCTNIKTYANLKYINKLYLKDQFLMIRDSDGKNPKYLKKQLCSYYAQRSKEDVGNLPQVEPKNVLILKYYSFENYFLDPKVMAKIGVIKSEEDFYNILYKKYKDYLFKLNSMKRLLRTKNFRIKSKQDIKDHIEDIKIYVRGHNLFDIFYGRYHGSAEQEILKKYIDVAPRETFQDIFDAIDSFVYFENRKK